MDRGAGTPVIYEGTLDAPRTFRGTRLRANLGKSSVGVRVNGKPLYDPAGPRPGGLRVHPRLDAVRSRSGSVPAHERARAGIVVTGTEVLTGRISDRNGPWLADRLLEMGIELAHITICGDRPEDIQAQLRFMADNGVDLIVTSGGLGPTADDMTVEMVSKFAGRPLVLDEALESRIADILRALMRRWGNRSFEAVRAANRKQALVPEGSHIIYPVGTAPGVVVPGKPAVVVLPGPPRELQPMWAEAVDTDIFREATAGRRTYVQAMMRLFGLPESSMAETLREAESEIDGLRPPRDHHLPAPRRGGGGDPLRARGRRDLRGAGGHDRHTPPA